jgi:hypothetical protein
MCSDKQESNGYIAAAYTRFHGHSDTKMWQGYFIKKCRPDVDRVKNMSLITNTRVWSWKQKYENISEPTFHPRQDSLLIISQVTYCKFDEKVAEITVQHHGKFVKNTGRIKTGLAPATELRKMWKQRGVWAVEWAGRYCEETWGRDRLELRGKYFIQKCTVS